MSLIIVLICGYLVTSLADQNVHIMSIDSSDRRLINDDDYMKNREAMITTEKKMRIGGTLSLDDNEQAVNKTIMLEKINMIEFSRVNHSQYIPSMSFYKVKPLIENSKLLKIIRNMPKGGALHVHDLSGVSLEWLIQNATYRDNIYMCVNSQSYIIFKAFKSPPQNPDCPWKSVKEERAAASSPEQFDASLRHNLSLMISDPVETFADNNKAWDRFKIFFAQVANLIYYVPVFKDYQYRLLEEFNADNVQYLELRTSLQGLYDLNVPEYDEEYALLLLKNITEDFMIQNPEFIGTKVIFCGGRYANSSVILENVKKAMYLYQKYPDFLAGYDLVSDEEWYHTLLYYKDALLYPSQQTPPYKLPYFFHAGETDWQDTEVDYNLFDAILLNTTRIGHGYALSKHPFLAKLVKSRQIAVEVNPISNQLLRLLTDLRNHPMIGLMSDNFPIVISSDDPSSWGADPLSHDMYMAFMTMSGEDGDLTFLKQLAMNSLQFSSMSSNVKQKAKKKWEIRWNTFIKQFS
ncbi:adenosine deaminase AGSA-like [Biomphalaria glabrata]|uniref:adenosine deaminase n=1 Tax=Biomphalaria glabrata TaxID=6526 RepID=A0A9U8EKM0_BIOGL|nr:adenosine deaminase AGSA-like [Biomphalaria glabrata]XP_013091581.2 adenosine deaminase AGSA-like [Biomphalaria glabrata]XP_013091582.2 adenosine deaminase AGSA-like [Biomphalaria glabrata]XP_013091583.2 adenosine deaminase AGSA-like [Biomphalaria glabrata]KAI8780575.1 adenosine deaminase AGSA [Biomphalaria glabrata]